jgi:iron donor protein CyaY
MPDSLTESEFRLVADAAIESLEKALVPLCDAHDVEVERQNGVLQVVFEAPPSKFVVSPNAPVRQIWVSAMNRSFKLSWAAGGQQFELGGESLEAMLARLVREHVGAA